MRAQILRVRLMSGGGGMGMEVDDATIPRRRCSPLDIVPHECSNVWISMATDSPC